MDIEALYRDYNIQYQTEGHKHCRPGWVNTECPFCTGNPGLHLGYDIDGHKFVCWRCGGHHLYSTLTKLLNVSYHQALEIAKQYGEHIISQKKNQRAVRTKGFKFPSNLMELQQNHRRYLENREFDVDYMIKTWGLMGTGVFSVLDEIDYKHRIIIPFEWDGKTVSFDSRDITGKHNNKYQACPKDRELIEHKHILYGKQDKIHETGIIVEGPTDVWRFGTNAYATSGIKYTPAQVRLIAKLFKRAPVVYDGNEAQARQQADKLVAELRFRGIDSFRVDIEGDPGMMSQDEANYLVKQLML